MDSRYAALLTFNMMKNFKRYFSSRIAPDFKVNASGLSSMSERQFLILLLIDYCGTDTLSALARALALSPSGLSTVVSKMAANGLLTKNPFPRDRDGRTVVFELTDKGRAALGELTDIALGNIERFYGLATEHERESFLEGYNLLSEAVLLKTINAADAVNSKAFADILLKGFIDLKRWADAYFIKRMAAGAMRLSPEQFHLLCFIKDFGLNTINSLSDFTGLSASALSLSIKNLSREGYIHKEKSVDKDARKLRFYITEKGFDKIAEHETFLISELTAFCETLEKRDMYCEAVGKLDRVFQSMNDRDPFKTGGKNET